MMKTPGRLPAAGNQPYRTIQRFNSLFIVGASNAGVQLRTARPVSGGHANFKSAVIQRATNSKWDAAIAYQPGDKIYGLSSYYNVAAEGVTKLPQYDDSLKPTVQSFIDSAAGEEGTPLGEWDYNSNYASKDDQDFKKFYDEQSGYVKKHGKITRSDYGKGRARACKAAIMYTATKGHKVHFIVTKEMSQYATQPNSKHYNSTTSRELRKVYRNWNTLQNSVIFYDGDSTKIVPAPWEASATKQYWDEYKQARQSKGKT